MHIASAHVRFESTEPSAYNELHLYRLPVHADGRCAVRACTGLRQGNSKQDRKQLREARMAAVACLAERMTEDTDLDVCVRCSFPDEEYESFEEWTKAMASDDTKDRVSTLWRGGGTWTLFGLALHLQARIYIHNVDGATGSLLDSSPEGVELFDARPEEGGLTLHLAAVRAEDGTPNHFDVLVQEPSVGAERLRYHRSSPRSAQRSSPFPMLLIWAALNAIAVAMVLAKSSAIKEIISRLLLGRNGATYLGLPISKQPDFMLESVRIFDHNLDATYSIRW